MHYNITQYLVQCSGVPGYLQYCNVTHCSVVQQYSAMHLSTMQLPPWRLQYSVIQ